MDARPSFGRLVRRGLLLRCPNCSGRGVVERWLRLRPRCPTCGMPIEREEGAFLGSWFLNICATQAALSVWLVAAFAVTLPHPPLGLILGGSAVIVVVVPVALFPVTKMTWAAIHLAMGPLEPDEEADRAVFRFERDDAGDPP